MRDQLEAICVNKLTSIDRYYLEWLFSICDDDPAEDESITNGEATCENDENTREENIFNMND